MITSPLEEYSYGEFVYGQLTEVTHNTETYLKLHIPILMTFGRTAPTKTKRSFNKNLFANDDACKVVSAGVINTQNYVTVEKQRDVNINHETDIDGYLRTGHKFIVQIMNKNLDDLWLTKSVRNRT